MSDWLRREQSLYTVRTKVVSPGVDTTVQVVEADPYRVYLSIEIRDSSPARVFAPVEMSDLTIGHSAVPGNNPGLSWATHGALVTSAWWFRQTGFGGSDLWVIEVVRARG